MQQKGGRRARLPISAVSASAILMGRRPCCNCSRQAKVGRVPPNRRATVGYRIIQLPNRKSLRARSRTAAPGPPRRFAAARHDGRCPALRVMVRWSCPRQSVSEDFRAATDRCSFFPLIRSRRLAGSEKPTKSGEQSKIMSRIRQCDKRPRDCLQHPGSDHQVQSFLIELSTISGESFRGGSTAPEHPG